MYFCKGLLLLLYNLIMGLSMVFSGIADLGEHLKDKPILMPTVLPVFIEPIRNVTTIIGREAILNCRINNLQGFTVAWLYVDSQTLLTVGTMVLNKNQRMKVTEEMRQDWKLHIKDVRETDAGTYMCQINTEPMTTQLGTISVVVPPDIEFKGVNSDVIVREGDDLRLKCSAKGVPEPTIVWKREDGKPITVSNKTKVNWNGDILRIPNVNINNSGAYFCIASNGIPPAVSKRIVVTVHYKPQIRVRSYRITGYMGESTNLTCIIEGSPIPNVYWYRAEMIPLPYGKEYSTNSYIKNNELISTLTVNMLTESTIGRYTCAANNEIGGSDAVIWLSLMTTSTSTTVSTTLSATSALTESPTSLESFIFNNVASHNQRRLDNYEMERKYDIVTAVGNADSTPKEEKTQVNGILGETTKSTDLMLIEDITPINNCQLIKCRFNYFVLIIIILFCINL